MWQPLQEVAEKCWVVWELMVLAQPLMVIAPSPGNAPQHLSLPDSKGHGHVLNGCYTWGYPTQPSWSMCHLQGHYQSKSSLLNPVELFMMQGLPSHVGVPHPEMWPFC